MSRPWDHEGPVQCRSLSVAQACGRRLVLDLLEIRVVDIGRRKVVLELVFKVVFLSQTRANLVVRALLNGVINLGCVLAWTWLIVKLLGN